MRRAAAASALRPEFRPGLQSWPPPFEARRAGRAPCPRPPWRWRLRLCRRDNGRGSPAATEAMPELGRRGDSSCGRAGCGGPEDAHEDSKWRMCGSKWSTRCRSLDELTAAAVRQRFALLCSFGADTV